MSEGDGARTTQTIRTPNKKVEKRTQWQEKTVEEEKFRCPNCTQWYDEDEIADVGIGYYGEESEEVARRTQLCTHCVRSVFEYELPDSAVGYALDQVRVRGWRETLAVAFAIVGGVAVVATGLAMIIVSLASLGAVFSSVSVVNSGTATTDIFGLILSRMFMIGLVLGFTAWITVGAMMELEDDDDD